jgi:RND superfamily putative drug exporter
LTAFLNVLTDDLSISGAGGFYLSQEAVDGVPYQTVKKLLFSADGRTTRLFVYSDGDALGADGARVATAAVSAVAEATKYGPLAESTVAIAGRGSLVNALGSQWHTDFGAALLTSFGLILILSALALRSLLAGIAVAAVTLASYVLGLGVVVFVWTHLLGTQINWIAPLVSLVIVAAVAGDDAFRLTARAVERTAAKYPRTNRNYGGSAPLTATAFLWIVVVIVWTAAVAAGSTAALTSGIGQIGAIVGLSLPLSYIVPRMLLVVAACWAPRGHTRRKATYQISASTL